MWLVGNEICGFIEVLKWCRGEVSFCKRSLIFFVKVCLGVWKVVFVLVVIGNENVKGGGDRKG